MKTNKLVASGYLWATLFLAFSLNDASAQTQTPRYQSIISNSNAFYEALPQGYNSESQTYPLIVFLTGIGELGDGSPSNLPTVLRNGPPKQINEGTFPVSFTVNGESFKFIVISPQFINWPNANDVQGVIDYAVKSYRVNTNRIYVTGLSMGGGATWDYATNSVAFAKRIAAIVPVCGASDPAPERAQTMVSANLPVWALQNQDDPTVPVSNTINYVKYYNALSPAIPAKMTLFPISGHDAWTAAYDLNLKENNMNVYEWMLQYQRGNSQPTIQLPVSNSGSDVTLTLPANSVTLAGSGTKNGGTITSYSWNQVSGPQQLSINNNSIANPTLSNLVEGSYDLRLTVTDNSGASASDDVNINVNAAAVGTVGIPGRVEAENYAAMSGIQTQPTSDVGGGKDVGWLDVGDWMDYQVNVAAAGNYTVNFRVASPNAQQLQLKNSAGAILATVNVPQTGGYQNWITVSATVALAAGDQALRIYASNGDWNINWMDFIALANASGIPGRIEAENYDAMNGIYTENTTDAGGGKNVGWIDTGDWMDYNTSVSSAGNYTANFRVSSPFDGQQLQVRNAAGTVLATVTVPQTNGTQNWTTVSASISLPAGNQTLRIYSSNGSWNINWIDFTATAQASLAIGSIIPGKIEAENYNAMKGTQTENTADAGGGKNVGWLSTGEWLDYNVSVTTAGNYTVNYRVATPYDNQQLQLKNAAGEVLQTVMLPQTGGYQNWTTVSSTVSLPAGNQTIRIYSSNGSWNINWFEVVSSATASNANIFLPSSSISEQGFVSTGKESFSIYPNPVKDNFSLQLNNTHLGKINIQVADRSGKIMKTFQSEKSQSASNLNLMVSDLSPGIYFLKITIGNWSDSKKLIKL